MHQFTIAPKEVRALKITEIGTHCDSPILWAGPISMIREGLNLLYITYISIYLYIYIKNLT